MGAAPGPPRFAALRAKGPLTKPGFGRPMGHGCMPRACCRESRMRESEKLDEAERAARNMKRIVRKWLGPGGKRRRLVAKIMEIWENRFWGNR